MSHRMIHVIVVEDDPDQRDTLTRYLAMVGMDARSTEDGHGLESLMDETPADVVLLDVNLPGENGFVIAGRLRARSRAGIIMLTARGQLDDRVVGLTAGADAYIVKPVQLRELEIMIRNLACRVRGEAPSEPSPRNLVDVRPGEACWRFDRRAWILRTPQGAEIGLTAAEYKVLDVLVTRFGESVSRDDIAGALGRTSVDYEDRSLDAIFARLRRKVQHASGEGLPIKAVRSIGYVFAGQVEIVGEASA